jgi:hypothetical protein
MDLRVFVGFFTKEANSAKLKEAVLKKVFLNIIT